MTTTWHDVRAIRANPPRRAAATGRRRKTFGSALQQAEELASAAERAGYSSKPILLFYALAQAYRALCAAHLVQNWEPTGHGLSVPNRGLPLLHVVVKSDGYGLYQSAMSVVDEPALTGEVTIGSVWAANSEIRDNAPADVLAMPGGLTLYLPYQRPTEPAAPDDLFVCVEGLSGVTDVASMNAALADYPTLASAQPATFPTGLYAGSIDRETDRNGLAFRMVPQAGEELPVLKLPLTNPADYQDRFQALAPVGISQSEDMRVAQPAIGNPPQTLEPVGLWWVLLLGLSSLARYHPALWVAALDVDNSPHAVGLQRLLDRFQAALPFHVLNN